MGSEKYIESCMSRSRLEGNNKDFDIFVSCHYIIITVPGTPNNQLKMDGNGDFQPFPM